MSKSVKYSIVVAVYNRPEEMEELLHSLNNQSFKNFELIIVDDGSKDKESLELLKIYEDDTRIFLIRQENHGLTYSNNVALKNSTGKYIMRLDADDYLHKNCVEELVKVLDKNSELALVFPD